MRSKTFFAIACLVYVGGLVWAESPDGYLGNLYDASTGFSFTAVSIPSTSISVLPAAMRSAEKPYLVALDNFLKRGKAANPAWCSYKNNGNSENTFVPILGMIPGLKRNNRLTYVLNSRISGYQKEGANRRVRLETWYGITDYPESGLPPVDRMLTVTREFSLMASSSPDSHEIKAVQIGRTETVEFADPEMLTWTVDLATHRLFVASSRMGEIRRYNKICAGEEKPKRRTPTGTNLATWSPKWGQPDQQYVTALDRAARTRSYDFYHVAETPSSEFRYLNRHEHSGIIRIENHDYTSPEGEHTGFIYGGLPRIRYNYKSPGNPYYGFAFHGRNGSRHVYGQNHSHGCFHLAPEVIKEMFFLACQWYRWHPDRSIKVKIYENLAKGMVHRPGTEKTYGRLDAVAGY